MPETRIRRESGRAGHEEARAVAAQTPVAGPPRSARAGASTIADGSPGPPDYSARKSCGRGVCAFHGHRLFLHNLSTRSRPPPPDPTRHARTTPSTIGMAAHG